MLIDGQLARRHIRHPAAADAVKPWTDSAVWEFLGQKSSQSQPQPPVPVPVLRAVASDAAEGGCVLSAAELDSSKQYLQLDVGWRIAYLVRELS